MIENYENKSKEEINEKMKELRKIALKNRPKTFEGFDLSKDKNIDALYDAEIYLCREPGMRSSIQVITSHIEDRDCNIVSILTLTSSFLETLLHQNIVTPTVLEDLVDNVINNYRKYN